MRRELTAAELEIQDQTKWVLPDCPSVHAEMNALLQCNDRRHACALYTTTFPCIDCAKAIANTEIKNIFYLQEYDTNPQNKAPTLEVFKTAEIIVERLIKLEEYFNEI
jgi:dCMP deaminase